MPNPPTVLIVDDSEAICLVLQMALATRHIRALTATTRDGALRHVAQVGLDALTLAVLDVYLDREPSGYTLYDQWRLQCPRLPVVLMSGAPDAPALPAVRTGAVPLIAKPFDLNLVLPQLATLIERSPNGSVST